jgi:hypothetical protein
VINRGSVVVVEELVVDDVLAVDEVVLVELEVLEVVLLVELVVLNVDTVELVVVEELEVEAVLEVVEVLVEVLVEDVVGDHGKNSKNISEISIGPAPLFTLLISIYAPVNCAGVNGPNCTTLPGPGETIFSNGTGPGPLFMNISGGDSGANRASRSHATT